MTEEQNAAKVQTGYYGSWARCRNLSQDEVMSRLEAGQPYTIRFRAPDNSSGRIEFVDLIRGRIEHQDNVNDIVLLKSSDQSPRLPTYHFAHVVDDTLMRVTVVLRGEEWISSVPGAFATIQRTWFRTNTVCSYRSADEIRRSEPAQAEQAKR
jgi:glutamyl-tRNA synthetase